MKRSIFIAVVLFVSPFLSAEEVAVPAAPLMANELLDKMAPHLVSTGGEKVAVNLKEKEHVLIYWSASWCGPCREFSPKLVEFYKQNGGGQKFEIVLMCLDHTADKMATYMKSTKMPWPAVSFDQKANTGAKEFVKTNIKGGIPRLMVINKKGEVLAAGNGPVILAQFKKILAEKP